MMGANSEGGRRGHPCGSGRMTGARRLVIGVALAAAMGGCRETQRVEHPLTPVRAQTAEMAPAANALRYSATIQPVAQINLAFKVGGYVAEILQVPGVGGEDRKSTRLNSSHTVISYAVFCL